MNKKIPSLVVEFGHLKKEIRGLQIGHPSRQKLKKRRTEVYKHLSFYYDQIPQKVRKILSLKRPDKAFYEKHTSSDNEYLA